MYFGDFINQNNKLNNPALNYADMGVCWLV